ncbi:MAG: hypothetical protein Q9168_008383, partial [Polycauliona sp. 1 TL-2023]
MGRLLFGLPQAHTPLRPPSPPQLQQPDLQNLLEQPTYRTMGTWGPGLYQSDIDLELLDVITNEALKMMSDPECLCSALMPDSHSLRAPIDRHATVQQLEDGIVHRMIRRFNYEKMPGAIVILGVVCMELGVKITAEDMLEIKMALM